MQTSRPWVGAVGALAFVALVAGAATWLARESSRPAAGASQQPSQRASDSAKTIGSLYPVNGSGSSIDFDSCVTPAHRYGETQSDWGEDYLDGNRLVLNFTGEPDEHVAALRKLLPGQCSVWVRQVANSSAVGRALQAEIASDQAALGRLGVDVTSVAFDPTTDTVRIGVLSLTRQVLAVLESRYGVGLITVTQEPRPSPVSTR